MIDAWERARHGSVLRNCLSGKGLKNVDLMVHILFGHMLDGVIFFGQKVYIMSPLNYVNFLFLLEKFCGGDN
jgi:hypothetical protein